MTTSPQERIAHPMTGRDDVDAILGDLGDLSALAPDETLERLTSAHEAIHAILTAPAQEA